MRLRSTQTPILLLLLAFGPGARLSASDASKTKVLDLNQVDVEQVDDNWENQPSVPKLNPSNGLRVKDIIEPTTEYTYASFGKADPFAMSPTVLNLVSPPSVITDAETGAPVIGPSGKEITVNSPLQAYPITSLQVKGVWQTAEGEFRAVILTPKHEGIVVKAGDPISSGKVLGIQKDGLLVRLYKLRKDGVREYDDHRMDFGVVGKVEKSKIKLEPGKEAVFPGMDEPADSAAAKTVPTPANTAAPKAPPIGFKNPDEKAQAIPAADTANAAVKPAATPQAATPQAAMPQAATAPAQGQAQGPQPLGWPYNNGPATPPAAKSSRPGSSSN